MSRFADPTAVEVVPLGPCQCPGTPHERDEATVRWQLGASALARVGASELLAAARNDPFASWRQLVLECVVSWNLMARDEDGEPYVVAITPAAVAELDEDTLKELAVKADALIQSKGSLPNDSGAPSAESSRESASPTPTPSPEPGT